jgi:hypothetical protein
VPPLTTTRTRTVLFDRDLISELDETVSAIRVEWKEREPYVDDPRVRAAAEARLNIATGLVEILKDEILKDPAD